MLSWVKASRSSLCCNRASALAPSILLVLVFCGHFLDAGVVRRPLECWVTPPLEFNTYPFFLVHGGCPPASITQKRPTHGQVSVHGEPKSIEGQQPYVQYLRGCDPAPKCTKGLVTVGCGFAIGPVVGVMTRDESKIKGNSIYIYIYL